MLFLHSGGREFKPSDDHLFYFKYRFRIHISKHQFWLIFDLKLKTQKFLLVPDGNFDNIQNNKKKFIGLKT
jgi:hypothetical protein